MFVLVIQEVLLGETLLPVEYEMVGLLEKGSVERPIHVLKQNIRLYSLDFRPNFSFT